MKKILVVEDEAMIREAFVYMLKKEKFNVAAASNGHQAIELFHKHKPDLVLLDMLLPDMHGIDVLHECDPPTNFPTTKIIVITNLSDAPALKELSRWGVTTTVLKAAMSPKALIKLVKEKV